MSKPISPVICVAHDTGPPQLWDWCLNGLCVRPVINAQGRGGAVLQIRRGA
jgi:hypothetical protein